MTQPPIGCAEAVRRLWDYLEDSLDPPDHQAVEAHLAWCVRCCGELEFAREVQHLLRLRSGSSLPAEVQDRLERVIDAWDEVPGEEVPR